MAQSRIGSVGFRKLEISAKYNLNHPDEHEVELLRTFSVSKAVKRLNIPAWKSH